MDKKSTSKNQYNLTPRQQLFCDEWLIHRNATRAYLKAYDVQYHSARVEGCKHLTKPAIKAYLDEKLAEIEKRYDKSGINDISTADYEAFKKDGSASCFLA